MAIETPRQAYVDLLYLAGYLPGLENVESADDAPNPFEPAHDADGRSVRVSGALVVMGDSIIDPDQIDDQAGDDERQPYGDVSAPDRLRALGALLRIRTDPGIPIANPGETIHLDHLRAMAAPAIIDPQRTSNDDDPSSDGPTLLMGDMPSRDELADHLGLAPSSEPDLISPGDAAEAALVALDEKYSIDSGRYPLSFRHAYYEMTPEEQANMATAFGPSAVRLAAGACRDEPIQMPDGRDAMRITARIEMNRPIMGLAQPTDPLNWPPCDNHRFFHSMVPVGGGYSESPADDDEDGANANDGQKVVLSELGDTRHVGYRARLRETVNFGPPMMVTDLDVAYFVNPEVPMVGMTYHLGESRDGNIDFDQGYIWVTIGPKGNAIVEAQKSVRFTTMSNATGAWACLLGWLDAMERMNRCQIPN